MMICMLILNGVGKVKSLGCLSTSTISEGGFDIEEVSEALKQQGISIFISGDGRPTIQHPIPTLYAYHKPSMVKNLSLAKNKAIIKEYNWPEEPDELSETFLKTMQEVNCGN